MKRLKLKCIPEKTTPQHNPDPVTNDHIEKFNQELKRYCDAPHSKEKHIEYYKWYHTDNIWPLDKNEDILMFQDNNFAIYRSFSVLQNLIYKIKVMGVKDRTDFYWMRIKTPSGKPLYEE